MILAGVRELRLVQTSSAMAARRAVQQDAAPAQPANENGGHSACCNPASDLVAGGRFGLPANRSLEFRVEVSFPARGTG
jgi:hypothetical protein